MADTKLPPPPDFKGDWITPDHSEYNTAIARWARNAQRNAAAVAFVRDAEDVATVIEFARAQELPIAVRGGGHSAGGASSVDNGVVIDLSRYINGARVDAERRLVYTGGGALWKTVDEEGIKHGLATVGGTVNHTGVGGLVLGGGIGHLMGEHGHAVDNLVQVTIVTADGSILTASERENSELFWGVRGGGSNFGVVTEFVLKLHPQRATAFCGNVIFPGSAAKPLFEALKRWWEAGPSPKTSILSMMTLGPDGKPAVVIAVFYNGPEREAREYFKFIYDLGPVLDTAKEIPFEQVNTIQNSNVGHGKNYYMKGTFSSRLRPDVSIKILDRIAELSPAIGVQILYMHELFPSGKAHSIPRDSTAFVRWEGVSNAATLIWEDESPGKLELARDAAKQLNAILAEGEDVISPVANTGYGNYDMDEKTAEEDRKARKGDLAASLFGDHYPRMQALKKKYDPNMVFSRWNPIRPL